MTYKNTILGRTAQQRVEHALQELRAGKGLLLLDDVDRENDADLVFAAEKMSVTQMAQMIRHCSGVVCLCMPQEKADQLALPYMVEENSSRYQTAFTISIDAKEGISTGLSAADRIAAIRAATADHALPSDLARPGHIFPLRAQENGVLARNGHTEGSVDLMKLAGLKPLAVLCELMNDDGSMARLTESLTFAEKNNLAFVFIADIIAYRKTFGL